MAKYKRVTIGSIVKGKDGKPDYIKVRGDHVLKDGQYLNLESKAQQLAKIDESEKSGKLSADMATKIRERVNKMPDFVRFEVVSLKEE